MNMVMYYHSPYRCTGAKLILYIAPTTISWLFRLAVRALAFTLLGSLSLSDMTKLKLQQKTTANHVHNIVIRSIGLPNQIKGIYLGICSWQLLSYQLCLCLINNDYSTNRSQHSEWYLMCTCSTRSIRSWSLTDIFYVCAILQQPLVTVESKICSLMTVMVN